MKSGNPSRYGWIVCIEVDVCQNHQSVPAGIPAARISAKQARIAKSIAKKMPRKAFAATLLSGVMTRNGGLHGHAISISIPCARNVCDKAGCHRRPWSTTSFRTGGMSACSGIKPTGSRYARLAMIGKRAAEDDAPSFEEVYP